MFFVKMLITISRKNEYTYRRHGITGEKIPDMEKQLDKRAIYGKGGHPI